MPKSSTDSSPDARVGLLAELVRSAQLAWRLLRDSRVATTTKLLIPGLVAAYVLWPVDLLPDFVPLLGQLDDLAIFALAVRLFIEMCPPAVVQEHRNNLIRRATRSAEKTTDPDGQVIDGEYRVIK